MKRYLADLLTLLRLVLAWVVIVAILRDSWSLALGAMVAAVLSDALDGPCARRWPYTEEQTARLPWRKIDHHMLDNIPDGLMVLLAVVGLISSVPYWLGIAALIYVVSTVFFVAVQLLIRKGKPTAAERVDVVYGWWFALNLAAILAELSYRAGYLSVAIVVGSIVAVPLLWYKRDRALTRPETRESAQGYVH